MSDLKVFSSYYDKTSELDKNVYTFVRVSYNPPPQWFFHMASNYADMSDLFAPTKEMLETCHPTKDWEAFKPRYIKEILGTLNKAQAIKSFENIYAENGNRPLVLVCFEAPPENCHRQLIGEFLGIDIKEI